MVVRLSTCVGAYGPTATTPGMLEQQGLGARHAFDRAAEHGLDGRIVRSLGRGRARWDRRRAM